MKLKYGITFIGIVCSFYLTDRIMIYINSKNPIMQEIVMKQDDYRVEAVNAIIDENTIIPGINGKEVDVDKSFNRMDDVGYFNELYIVYKDSTPKLSLNDNKEKIIIKGNQNKNMIAMIVDHNDLVSDYLKNINIKFTTLAKIQDNLLDDAEYINGEADANKFSDLNSLLNHKKINSNICLVNYSNLNECKKNNYYMVNYSINMADNIYDNLSKLGAGDIIFVSSNTTITQIKLLINEITRLDLKVDYLSNLISEKN